MKQMRKAASLILAMIMVVAMAISVSAATVSISGDLSGHTFKAYQIFSGTAHEGTLTGVEWGSGINSEAFLTAVKGIEGFEACETAADVAEVLGTVSDNAEVAKKVAKIACKNVKGEGTVIASGETELADGYYVIVDTTDLSGQDAANNAALLQVTGKGNIDIAKKTDKPSIEKKVLEDDKYNNDGGYGQKYNDVADHNMGDDVPFAFYSKVPDMTYYETYKFIIHDQMSAGLTFNNDVTVTIGGVTLDPSQYEVVTEGLTDGCTFEVRIADLKKIESATTGAAIRVDFTAELNKNAVVGLDGNPNKVKLEYSNKPDASGSGDGSGSEGGEGGEEGGNTGSTPWDTVIVFTYELDINKVDGANQETKLADAEFVLYRTVDGTNEYVIVDADGKVSGWTTNKEEASTLSTDENGICKVIGLDDGTYYLEETKAPAGYNQLEEPITIVVTATTSNGQDWTSGVASDALTALAVTSDGVDGAADVQTGAASITVANNKGATLPETGGMGTKVFYLLGSVLVIGAVVVYITRKRMNA